MFVPVFYIYIRADRLLNSKRGGTTTVWPMNAVQSGFAKEERYAFRLESRRLPEATARGGQRQQQPGNQGRTLQRPPPFEGPVLRAVLSKIKTSRDLTKEVLLPKGTTHVGGASHYFPINPQLSLT